MSTQGWDVDATAHTITFLEAPANGAAIVVNEFATPAGNSTPLWAIGAWGPYSGYPIDVEFFSNRLFFAGTENNPQTLWSSKVSQWNDFGTHVPIEDDDAITATLVSKQQNAIRDLIPLQDLVTLTAGSEWRTTGGSNEVLTPSSISFKPQSQWGAAAVGGLQVGDNALFVQGRGAHIRDIGYQFATDNYTGNDVTVFAAHLVDGFQIVDWCYQQTPFSVVWVVRDDGTLLGLAYLKEQEVMGWFHCDTTNGFVESVCSVPEGSEDAVYMIVRRVIGDVTKRYVERLNTRFFEDQRDAFFVDCGLSYDGRNSTTAPTAMMTLSGGVHWTDDEALTLTCTGYAPFASTNIGDNVKLYINGTDTDGNPTQAVQVLQITGYTDSTHVTVKPIGGVPIAFQNVAIASWDFCTLSVSGLDHLEGQAVSVLADANAVKGLTVTAGKVTLQYPAAVIHVGLPIRSDFETLEVNAIGQESVRDKRKIISKVTLIVNETRGSKIGPDTDHFETPKPRSWNDKPWSPNSLNNDLIEIYMTSQWGTGGHVFVRQEDPLPLTILGLIADVSVAGG